MVVWSVEK